MSIFLSPKALCKLYKMLHICMLLWFFKLVNTFSRCVRKLRQAGTWDWGPFAAGPAPGQTSPLATDTKKL